MSSGNRKGSNSIGTSRSWRNENLLTPTLWVVAQRITRETVKPKKAKIPGRGKSTGRLTEDQVREIRRAVSAGESQASVAKRFGMKDISGIVNGVNYAWVK